MANLTPQNVEADGIAATLVAAAGGGDEADVQPGDILVVVNGSGASINVTVNTPVARKGVAQYVVAVPAGATRYMALAPRNTIGHSQGFRRSTNANDRAYWTYSAVTSVTVGVLRAVTHRVVTA